MVPNDFTAGVSLVPQWRQRLIASVRAPEDLLPVLVQVQGLRHRVRRFWRWPKAGVPLLRDVRRRDRVVFVLLPVGCAGPV